MIISYSYKKRYVRKLHISARSIYESVSGTKVVFTVMELYVYIVLDLELYDGTVLTQKNDKMRLWARTPLDITISFLQYNLTRVTFSPFPLTVVWLLQKFKPIFHWKMVLHWLPNANKFNTKRMKCTLPTRKCCVWDPMQPISH